MPSYKSRNTDFVFMQSMCIRVCLFLATFKCVIQLQPNLTGKSHLKNSKFPEGLNRQAEVEERCPTSTEEKPSCCAEPLLDAGESIWESTTSTSTQLLQQPLQPSSRQAGFPASGTFGTAFFSPPGCFPAKFLSALGIHVPLANAARLMNMHVHNAVALA